MSGYRRGALRDGVALALVLSTATLHATCCASGWRCIAHIARVSSAEINIGTHFCCTICIMCFMGGWQFRCLITICSIWSNLLLESASRPRPRPWTVNIGSSIVALGISVMSACLTLGLTPTHT